MYTAWWIRTFTHRELKEFGLTPEQFNVMRILKGKHPEKMCVRDIACRMIEKNSNVPRIVDRLEAKQLVTRTVSSTDKRETEITLTNQSVELLKQASERIDEVFTELITMSEDDAQALNGLLDRYHENG